MGFPYTAARVGILDSKSAPTEIPRGLKKLEKKCRKNHPKKRHEHCLLCWPAGAKKKKSVLSKRKLVGLSPGMPWKGLPVHSWTKHHNISNPVRVFSPSGHLFLACARFGALYRTGKAGSYRYVCRPKPMFLRWPSGPPTRFSAP